MSSLRSAVRINLSVVVNLYTGLGVDAGLLLHGFNFVVHNPHFLYLHAVLVGLLGVAFRPMHRQYISHRSQQIRI